eukprot:512474-Hanusia_phi.AAC.1
MSETMLANGEQRGRKHAGASLQPDGFEYVESPRLGAEAPSSSIKIEKRLTFEPSAHVDAAKPFQQLQHKDVAAWGDDASSPSTIMGGSQNVSGLEDEPSIESAANVGASKGWRNGSASSDREEVFHGAFNAAMPLRVTDFFPPLLSSSSSLPNSPSSPLSPGELHPGKEKELEKGSCDRDRLRWSRDTLSCAGLQGNSLPTRSRLVGDSARRALRRGSRGNRRDGHRNELVCWRRMETATWRWAGRCDVCSGCHSLTLVKLASDEEEEEEEEEEAANGKPFWFQDPELNSKRSPQLEESTRKRIRQDIARLILRANRARRRALSTCYREGEEAFEHVGATVPKDSLMPRDQTHARREFEVPSRQAWAEDGEEGWRGEDGGRGWRGEDGIGGRRGRSRDQTDYSQLLQRAADVTTYAQKVLSEQVEYEKVAVCIPIPSSDSVPLLPPSLPPRFFPSSPVLLFLPMNFLHTRPFAFSSSPLFISLQPVGSRHDGVGFGAS